MDHIILAKQVEERYRRYLKTLFYFKAPELRESFAQKLDDGQLAKGPFLEATPVFERGQTPVELFTTLLQSKPEGGFMSAVQGERALYHHQEQAIRKSFEGRNVLVATGTGSGKTESFLFPILLHLYEEHLAGKLGSGVRALVLYPMNALANDQRERLGEIAQQLKEANSAFHFTFGQYIGETPENEKYAPNVQRLPGELVFRDEMRATPPHILLTNYSMLEYLLLRPKDSDLFDNGRARWWKFLVLDEAHQYRGSRGIEMAMLLRRLKQRLLEGGRTERFQCIATSATLVEGDKDAPAVAEFATNLFGEEFDASDVIFGKRVPIPEAGKVSLGVSDYLFLNEWLQGKNNDDERLRLIAQRLSVTLNRVLDRAKCVGPVLERDARATHLRRCLSERPLEVESLAVEIFSELDSDENHIHALAELVELLVNAQSPETGAPLLSARYHLFLRSLEGAFVSYIPPKQVFLNREGQSNKSVAFEIALCRECGQHYFVGQVRGGKLVEAIRDPSQDEFGADYFRPIEQLEDEVEDTEDDDKSDSKEEYFLCAECGEIGRKHPSCGHAMNLRVVKEPAPKNDDRKDQLARCGACGYNAAGRDPVRELIHGADGPHAVISTTLFQELPQDRRKVLAFADGRQEAAFFAWYLDDSYRDLLNRNHLLKAARANQYADQGLSLQTLARDLNRMSHDENTSEDASTLMFEAWRAVYREFLTDEQRISLEGVGVIRWAIQLPKWITLPKVLLEPPWSFAESEARDLLLVLLDTLRQDYAVEILTERGVSLNLSDINEQAALRHYLVGQPRKQKYAKSWDSQNAKRARYLVRLLQTIGISEDEARKLAVKTLQEIWGTLTKADESADPSDDPLLFQFKDGRRLNPRWYRLFVMTDDQVLYQCNTCQRLQPVSVWNVCARPRCKGSLQPKHPTELLPNHYRELYQAQLPGKMRVEEHTAQLSDEKAREFQRLFREDRIDVLSCSTTFELGVDLGNLDTIFLRNVPPESFNYAQRVGRAGRRSGHPGFAITYCRRNSHDLYHFQQPTRMLSGQVRPPALAIQNDKIVTRHITATALSKFFRENKDRFINVASFVKDWDNPTAVSDFKAYSTLQREALEATLRAIVPHQMHERIGLANGQWIERVAGTYIGIGGTEESHLVRAEADVVSDYKNALNVREEAKEKNDGYLLNWANARAKTLADEDVLSFLSRQVVIPKYGFPVDVVELDAQRIQKSNEAGQVSLQRDLSIAISEFAPGSALVANKKLWKSYGLKKVAEKEWERRHYKRCQKHNIYLQWKEGETEPLLPCGDRPTARGTYVIPRFGFVTNRDKPQEPTSRPVRVFTTRPYFVSAQDTNAEHIMLPRANAFVQITATSPGQMAVVCEGRRGAQFYICTQCGAGFQKREKEHANPLGLNCRGTLAQAALGHEFYTDVLQIQFLRAPATALDPIWFAFSLAYSLVEGAAERLEVPTTDLSATVAHGTGQYIPPIILYDNVPGGAGLVARIEKEDVFKDCMKLALKRVSGECGCGENESCYGCLRNYRNQFAHTHLQRGPVSQYLNELLASWQ